MSLSSYYKDKTFNRVIEECRGDLSEEEAFKIVDYFLKKIKEHLSTGYDEILIHNFGLFYPSYKKLKNKDSEEAREKVETLWNEIKLRSRCRYKSK